MIAYSDDIQATPTISGTVKLGVVGDIMLGELLENYRNGVRAAISRQGVDPFEFVRPKLANLDLNIGNLECPVANMSTRKGFFRDILRAPAEFADILAFASFNVLGIANNHALDHGREALKSTVDSLEERGIAVVGVENGRIKQTKPVVASVRNKQFHFWAFNLSNLIDDDFNHRVRHIRGCLRDYVDGRSGVILYLHWGEEYTNVPPSAICRVAGEFIEMGVDCVIGHHSHRLQGTARIRGGVFAPSLGNFIFDDRRASGSLSGILKLDIDDQMDFDWELIPLTINLSFQPVPDQGRAHEIALLDEKLAMQLRAAECGDQSMDAVVARHVARGHAANRYRMRLLMLLGFWRYAGAYMDILRYLLGRGGNGFSVGDEGEWNDDIEKC